MDVNASKDRGLENRFKVERLTPSSRGIDHSDCQYFVLDPQHDHIARQVLRVYATTAREEGFEALADDLEKWVGGIKETVFYCDECGRKMIESSEGSLCPQHDWQDIRRLKEDGELS